MKKIFKYKLAEVREQTVMMPSGAIVLTAQVQGLFFIYLWAIVEEGAPEEERRFAVIGTGHNIENSQKLFYISTIQAGEYVWHIFEVLT